ncbi:flagellar biosynthetic protein FliO [Nitrococcus mobilis]|uniref:Flagellar protein n=1 Tax=Nitrococcus mobilis Nb-231 TaxID=314278 RepID=A4BUE5_9GAMM|nr:flagellar biosynthetic protein FliO [Nitrococcus mobilis]EAR20659.1 Flagellar biosynthesis protein, FliO [Nitrococcus mobilis Nb-231]
MGSWGIGRIAGAVLVNFPAAAAQAAARVDGSGVDMDALLRLTFALGVVLAAIIGLAWLLRRVVRFNHGAAGQLRILGGLAVGSRERIVLVQVGKAQLLVGVAPGRVQTLHVLDEPIEVPAVAAPGADGRSVSFAQRLRAVLEEHGKR